MKNPTLKEAIETLVEVKVRYTKAQIDYKFAIERVIELLPKEGPTAFCYATDTHVVIADRSNPSIKITVLKRNDA